MKKERPLIRYEKLSKEDLVDYCRVYWRRIHNDEELFNEIYKDIESLKEENKKLKKELELVRKNTRANVETLDLMYWENVDLKKENKELQRENKKLNEYNRRLKQGNDDLKEQNKKLKEDNRFLTKISKEYMEKENIIEVTEFTQLYKDDLEKENERLKKENEELQEYKRMYEWLC